jgi:hypothetical protein
MRLNRFGVNFFETMLRRFGPLRSLDKKNALSKLHTLLDGVLAQLVEHHNGIVGVKGSNPLGSTILPVHFRGVFLKHF